jgi:hypothetical protein
MRESDETFTIEDELDHFKHVSAVRASKIAKLKQQLKEAESVIEFYGDRSSWRYEEINDCEARIITDDLSVPIGWCEENGGKRARQYLTKYKTNE